MFGLRSKWDGAGATPSPRFFGITSPSKTTSEFTLPLRVSHTNTIKTMVPSFHNFIPSCTSNQIYTKWQTRSMLPSQFQKKMNLKHQALTWAWSKPGLYCVAAGLGPAALTRTLRPGPWPAELPKLKQGGRASR